MVLNLGALASLWLNKYLQSFFPIKLDACSQRRCYYETSKNIACYWTKTGNDRQWDLS
jgi:hypothetical protein